VPARQNDGRSVASGETICQQPREACAFSARISAVSSLAQSLHSVSKAADPSLGRSPSKNSDLAAPYPLLLSNPNKEVNLDIQPRWSVGPLFAGTSRSTIVCRRGRPVPSPPPHQPIVSRANRALGRPVPRRPMVFSQSNRSRARKCARPPRSCGPAHSLRSRCR